MARIAMTLGLDPATPGTEIVQILAKTTKLPPVPPVIVDDAPVHENIMLGDDVDLLKFPTPLIHAGDGGRYFNTLGFWVVRSPDGKWTNWSIARAMIIDGKHMSGVIAPYQHNGMIFEMWRKIGKPMPFALVQGAEPASLFAGGMPLADGVDEAGYLGCLFNEPLKLVRCKTVALEVPAEAEIVVEGHVSLTRRAPEGPMGEFHGYITDRNVQKPVYEISAITHRENALLPVTSAGKPVDEDHTITGVSGAAMVLQELRDHGLPVTSAWGPPEAAQQLLAISVPRDWYQKVDLSADDFVHKIAVTAKAIHGTQRFTRVLVCDDDIELSNHRDLMWAWNTRCHPATGRIAIDDQPINPAIPFYPEVIDQMRAFIADSTTATWKFTGTIEALNCLRSAGWDLKSLSDFDHNFPEDLRQRVLDQWV
jgi:4-hydroxy-3-polyprenylbenzoate decarboxylase